MEIDEKIKQEIRESLNRVTRADYDDDKIINFDYDIDDPKELVTLKKELAELMRKAEKWNAYQAELVKEKAHTERFISLMDAEEDELRRKARLWDEVEEIAKRNWMDDPCEDCPVEERCDSCNSLCGQAYSVVDALKEKWGWEECPNCEQGYAIRKVGDRMEGTTDRCQYCSGSGKIRAEWAREEG